MPQLSLSDPADSDQSNTHISISAAFHPSAILPSSPYPAEADTILLSSDSVFFYVHRSTLLEHSDNPFDGRLLDRDEGPYYTSGAQEQATVILVPEHSTVLNIMLHFLYEMPCERFHPDLDTLNRAFSALSTHGISPGKLVKSNSEVASLLLSFSPAEPLQVYALAASLGLESVALIGSRFALGVSPAEITDALAEQMGPIYLRRLLFLHLGRIEALKRYLLIPPDTHPPTEKCSLAEQKTLTRAWALATAYLAWDAHADMSAITISASLTPLVERLTCFHCRENLASRIRTLLHDWSLVKRTI